MAFLTPDIQLLVSMAVGIYLLLLGFTAIAILRDQRSTLSNRVVELVVVLFLPILGLLLVGGNRFYNFMVKKT